MRKQIKAVALAMILGLFTGCSHAVDKNVVNISILNSKPEIQKNIEHAANEFSDKYPEINVKVVQYSSLQEVTEKIGSMQNQGITPTLMIVDPLYIQDTKEDLVPLDSEEWTKDMKVSMGEASLNNEKQLITFPFALECMGFIYNEDVMKEAGIDVTQIRTRDKLEEAFKKVEAIGRKALVISNEDWSLSNHFLTTAFTVQSQEQSEVLQYLENLKQGKVNLNTDTKVNGLLDTFDLMKEYNIYKEDPMLPTSEKCAELLATKQVGFWYMGNWALKDLEKYNDQNSQFGLIPVPISNDASAFENNALMGVIKYLVIDKKDNSQEQQEAAKCFLNWLALDKQGQDFMVSEVGLIPGAASGQINYQDSLAKSIQSYQEQDQVVEQVMAYLPSDNISKVGSLMRQYLNNSIDRKTLLEGIEEAWKNKK